MKQVCRNAPPTPFRQPVWVADTVVGGPRLDSTGLVVEPGAGGAAPPPVRDVAYVVADLESGQILAAKAPHAWLRPASTLKTLTALTLIPRLDQKKVITATKEQVNAAGTRVGMLVGNSYPVGSLFDALLMCSANDAAYALADAAGGYDRTVALMNETADDIGAHDTIVVDPSGLDDGDQRTSAYDLALVGRAAMQLPAFRGYIVKRDALFPGGKDPDTAKVYPPFHIANINELLPHYPGAIGIKPGRTNRAQHTFLGAATRGGRTLLVSQMGSTTGDWEDTAALLDWGFANADRVAPVGRLVEPGEAQPPVVGSPSSTATGTAPAGQPTVAAGAGFGAGVGAPGNRALDGHGLFDDDTAATLVTAGLAAACVLLVGGGGFVVARRFKRPGARR